MSKKHKNKHLTQSLAPTEQLTNEQALEDAMAKKLASLTPEQIQAAGFTEFSTNADATTRPTVWMPSPPEPEVFRSGYARIEPLTDEHVFEVAGAIAELPPETFHEERVALIESVTCPFPGDPSMGDKDPEVVAWYRDNAPEEYARRYANRIIPQHLPEPPIESGPPKDFDDEEEPVKRPNVIMQ
jgi:hypothetical protein